MQSQALVQRIDHVLAEAYRTGTVEVDGGERVAVHPTGLRKELGAQLEDLLVELGARRTLETGFAFGLSGLFMLRAALRNGASPYDGPVHTALDPFQSTTWRRAGLRLFAQAGVSHLLRFEAAYSELQLPRFVEAGEQFDAVLIDGGHRFEMAFADLLFASRLVRPGGAVIVDDVWLPSVRAAVEYFTTNVGLMRDERTSGPAGEHFAVLRMPRELPKRAWDHYQPFYAGLGVDPAEARALCPTV
ncbi:MAG: class I SAM-dependent methyltransferase [Planctomycetota bacterium]